MKCAEVRKLVRLYLDSELDAKTSVEAEQHLESCAECSGLFEAEKKFDQRLGKGLAQGERTASLWDGIESRIEPANDATRSTDSTRQRCNVMERLWPFAGSIRDSIPSH